MITLTRIIEALQQLNDSQESRTRCNGLLNENGILTIQDVDPAINIRIINQDIKPAPKGYAQCPSGDFLKSK